MLVFRTRRDGLPAGRRAIGIVGMKLEVFTYGRSIKLPLVGNFRYAYVCLLDFTGPLATATLLAEHTLVLSQIAAHLQSRLASKLDSRHTTWPRMCATIGLAHQ